MKLSARDRRIVMILIPAVLFGAYWFLMLAPKRAEVAKAGEELSKQQERRSAAVGKFGQLTAVKANFANDYEAVVSLGKAIPSSIDMPSLIVQLDRAAQGTGIKFNRVSAGDRAAAPGQSGAASGSSSEQSGASGSDSGSGGSQPPAAPAGDAAAGGASAQSGPGRAAETAGNTVNQANAAAPAAGGAGGSAEGSSQPSTPPASAPAAGGAASVAPGLDSVPLDFTFTGSFFELADFFHELKRFVRTVNNRIVVSGRLMTIDSLTFASATFPKLKAEVTATVYLSPKAEGPAAGATPAGPAGAVPASAPGQPSLNEASRPPAPPTATVTP